MLKPRFFFRLFRYRLWARCKRFLTFYNIISVILICCILVLMVLTEIVEDEDLLKTNLDDFEFITYAPRASQKMVQQNKLSTIHKSKLENTQLRTKNTTLSKNTLYPTVHNTAKIADGEVKKEKNQLTTQSRSVLFKFRNIFPKIKIINSVQKVLINQPNVEPIKEKLVTPKKLTYRDLFVNALAHPRTRPHTANPHSGDRVMNTGLNDWIRVNNPREPDQFLVYSAFWDDRFDHYQNVRIMAVMVTKNSAPVFCKLVFKDGKVMEARVNKKLMNEHWKLRYASLFINCEVDKNIPPPLKVIVSSNRNYTYSAMLPVHQNKENIASPRGDIAVCVKPFHYQYNRATWMLEFIEFHRILGVNHFIFYNHTVGLEVDALLRHYTRQNLVTILPWNLPIPSQKEIRTEGIFSALNDCAYRTMFLFHYVVMLDFDEYIVPREHESYPDMLEQLEKDHVRIRGKPGSFVFKNTFFYLYWENDTTVYGAEPEKPPHNLPYLITQYKTRRLTTTMKVGSRSKYIIVPDRVIEVGNHVVWKHTSGSRAIEVQDTVALLHHYRICEFGGFTCLKKESLVDRTATKFGPDLLSRVRRECRIVYPDLKGQCPLSPPLGSPW